MNVGTIRKAFRLLTRDPEKFYRRMQRFVRPMRADYRKRLSISLREWTLYHQRNVAFNQCRWMGVTAVKNPLDAWIYQEIIYEAKPDMVVEIGSMEGGSTLYLANLLDLLGKGQVISIDIDRSKFCVRHDRIIVLTGSSWSPEIIAKVQELCEGKVVLVIQDAAHDKQGVLNDLRNYSRLVSVNSYFIVEDGVVDLFKPDDSIGSYGDGPLAAIDEFLAENPNFVADAARERYLLTYNPQGFLKRIG